MKNHKSFFVTIVLLLISLLISCDAGQANVACSDVEKFQSSDGIINVPQFKLGDVILLDTVRKTGQFFLNTNIDPKSLSSTLPIDSTVILTNTGFDISLSGDVSKASADVQAAVKTDISNNTTFFLSNSVRTNIANTVTEINKATNFQTIKTALISNPGSICMLVSGIIYADKFEFRVKKDRQASGNANIMKFGKFNINVDYTCQGSLNIDAKRGGVFYKPSFYVLNAGQDQMVIRSIKIDLSKYSSVQSLK